MVPFWKVASPSLKAIGPQSLATVGQLLFLILALLLLEEGEVLGVAGLLHLFAGDEAQGRAIDAVA